MWRVAGLALLLACAGCASQRIDLPRPDIQLQRSEAFFDLRAPSHDRFSWVDPPSGPAAGDRLP